MKEMDKALVNAYASFVVDPISLKILDYNDDGSRYVMDTSHAINLISDLIEWDPSIGKRLDFNRDKRIIQVAMNRITHQDMVVIVQKVVYSGDGFYNVTLVDNLEDIDVLESKSIENELVGNGLFSNIFKYSPIGLVLVDANTRLYKANKYMFDCFDLDYKEVIGKRFGNIFGCSIVAESKLLCGEDEGCKDCKLRNGITNVLNGVTTIEGIDLGHDFKINGRTVTKWFTVSASPVYYGKDVYALVSFVDITQRVRMEERLRELGITDALTQLYNRRHIMKLLTESLLTKELSYVAVSLLDIDDFKLVNDNYGHLMGDQVLMLIGDVLKEEVRFSDYVGRYGGEEFLIVFPDTDLKDARRVLERIQERFKMKSMDLVGKPLTFSSGLVEVEVSMVANEEDIRKVLNRVDQLMYQAKALGKDRIESLEYKQI
jgi:diguanylate cyclase (GGDEF)-like protein